jgi:hypothetical protein
MIGRSESALNVVKNPASILRATLQHQSAFVQFVLEPTAEGGFAVVRDHELAGPAGVDFLTISSARRSAGDRRRRFAIIGADLGSHQGIALATQADPHRQPIVDVQLAAPEPADNVPAQLAADVGPMVERDLDLQSVELRPNDNLAQSLGKFF